MATETANLHLSKPAQTDFYDVDTYNANLELIDAAMGAARAAEPYNAAKTYTVGDYCTHEGALYRCTTAITAAEAWTAEHWKATSIGAEFKAIYTALVNHTHDSRYYTESEMNTKLSGKSDTSHDHSGRVIQPTSIELFPGTSAGHGGYIDFHFNSDAADCTSRIYEPVKGVLKYNGHGIVSTANIIALYNAQITFENGVGNYYNSAIKSSSVTFVQWRAGAVSTLTDSVLSTTPQNGSMIIIAKAGITGGPLPVNILIINN